MLLIKNTKTMGRGVFAGKNFLAGETLEVCPVLLIAGREQKNWIGTLIEHYVFAWGESVALALGYGSLYNHSSNPNASHSQHRGRGTITFYALVPIKKGQQIFIDYGWKDDQYPFSHT